MPQPLRRKWIVLGAALALAPNAFAQETPPAGDDEAPAAPTQVPWDTSCSQATRQAEPDCEMSQMVIVPQSRQVLLRLEVQVAGGGAEPRMVLQLPHGIWLPAGVTLAVDDDEWQETAVQTCDGGGCYAGLPLDEAAIQRLQRGTQLTVTFRSLSREPVTVPVDLNGFTDSYAKIR